MSYRSYGGFAEGFKGGFGLMNDVMDRRARKEIAEEENRLKGVQLDNDKAYRDGVLANDKARIAADTAELNWAKNPDNPEYQANLAKNNYYTAQANLLGSQKTGQDIDNSEAQGDLDVKVDNRSAKEKQVAAARRLTSSCFSVVKC